MKNVKKLITMRLIDVFECSKNHSIEKKNKCESCDMNKMHRFSNRNFVRIEQRVTRKNQRIHTNIADEKKIIRTSKRQTIRHNICERFL